MVIFPKNKFFTLNMHARRRDVTAWAKVSKKKSVCLSGKTSPGCSYEYRFQTQLCN